MPARTRHVRTSCGLFNRNLAFRALIGQKQEVNEPHDTLDVEGGRVNQHSLALGALLIHSGLPLALLHREYVVAVLGRALLDICGK